MSTKTLAQEHTGLLRVLGRWDMTAIGVNQVIGGAIFAVPATLAAAAGGWSPWLVVLGGVASLLIAVSIAEAASRFDATGGPYLYTRAAFGRFAAFQVGWMAWITRVASWASILNVLASSLGFYWPALTAGPPRSALIVGVVAAVTAINARGIRQSSFAVNVLTAGKMTPLLLFVAVGIWFVDWDRLQAPAQSSVGTLSAAALMLIFAFGGYENVPIPAGEAREPRRAIPFAIVATVVIVALVMTMIQLVAVGTLSTLTTSATPLADAAAAFLGAPGAAILTAGAVVSMAGNNLGGALAGSRILFAQAEQGDVPAVFGRIHATYHTPIVAILTTSAVTLTLALSGTFEKLAEASAISRLTVYVAACASTLRLRSASFRGVVQPATFVAPFGPVIPSAAILVALTILAGATKTNLVAGLIAVAVGTVLFTLRVRREA